MAESPRLNGVLGVTAMAVNAACVTAGRATIRIDTLLRVLGVLSIRVELHSPLGGVAVMPGPDADGAVSVLRTSRFFDGLLPEGEMPEGLLRQHKIDAHDRLAQLLVVGGDLVGAVTAAASGRASGRAPS